MDISSLLNDCDALLVSQAIHIRYLCGFTGLSPTEREAYLLITGDRWYLCTYRLYATEAETVAREHPQIEIVYVTPEQPFAKTIGELLQNKRVGFESHSLTYAEYAGLPSTIVLVPTTERVETLRRKKTLREIETLKQACQLTDVCFTTLLPTLKSGQTEQELAWKIERYIRETGAELSFPPIVAFNEHTSIPHHVPQDSPLPTSAIILFDFGANIDGYHADMTRMATIGTPDQQWVDAYRTVLLAQETALEYLQHNDSGKMADQLAQDVLTQSHYPIYPHSLGHGVGLAIHEDPRLSVHRDSALEEGMVFSVEPATYLPGKFGIRIEDLVLKTATGIELLSQAPKDLAYFQGS